jgi:tripartite-type tricarboxylate transporter receptor subunit TctC
MDRIADHSGHAEGHQERINVELNRALRDPDLIAKFAQHGLSPAGGTPADFQRTIASDLKNWTETARGANITAE